MMARRFGATQHRKQGRGFNIRQWLVADAGVECFEQTTRAPDGGVGLALVDHLFLEPLAADGGEGAGVRGDHGLLLGLDDHAGVGALPRYALRLITAFAASLKLTSG